MPSAEIIAIGTELLLGQSQDTNTRFIAEKLQELGIDLFRTMIIGDNEGRIAQTILEAITRADIIITSGGLGPTIDDPTRNAVSRALGVELEYRPELWDQITERFVRMNRQPSANNQRQAFIPKGAQAVHNPVGTAPAFIATMGSKTIICLPGVPHEMKYIFENSILPFLQQQYHLHDVIRSLVLHTSGLGESQIDELVSDLEQKDNPTLGLLAHHGQIDLRITVKSDSVIHAGEILARQAALIRARLGDAVFGEGSDSLESAVEKLLKENHASLAIVGSGIQTGIAKHLSEAGLTLEHSCEIIPPIDLTSLKKECRRFKKENNSNYCLGVSLLPENNRQRLVMVLLTNTSSKSMERYFGDEISAALPWILTFALDFIRRNLSN